MEKLIYSNSPFMFQQKQLSIRTEALKHEKQLQYKLISISCQGNGFALAHSHETVLFENTVDSYQLNNQKLLNAALV